MPFMSTTTTTTSPAWAAARSAEPAGAERRGVALMIGGGVLLGTLGVFVEEAGQHPLTAVWFRCAFGALALLAWGAASGRLRELRLDRRGIATVAACGALVVFNWTLFFAAIERTSIGVATVVVHAQPLWLLALAAWWLHERVTRAQCIAAVVALGGLALASGLYAPGAAARPLDGAYAIGVAMCLAGSLSYAAVTLIAKCARGVSSYALAFWQCAIGALLLAWWPFAHGWPAQGAAWCWLAGLGVLHTGLAYVLLYAGMARLPASRVALLQFVYPAVAVLVDWAVYGRALQPLQWLGVLVMGAALTAARRPGAAR